MQAPPAQQGAVLLQQRFEQDGAPQARAVQDPRAVATDPQGAWFALVGPLEETP